MTLDTKVSKVPYVLVYSYHEVWFDSTFLYKLQAILRETQ